MLTCLLHTVLTAVPSKGFLDVASPVHHTIIVVSAGHCAHRPPAEQTDSQDEPPHNSLKHTNTHSGTLAPVRQTLCRRAGSSTSYV